jgi:hypothetical protein
MTGKFRYVVLPIVILFEKARDVHVSRSVEADRSEEHENEKAYKKKPIKDENGKTDIRNVPVILNPDGSIWKHGSLYILSRAMSYDPPKDKTLEKHAKNLVYFRNTLALENIDYLSTPLRRHLRPTYFYK